MKRMNDTQTLHDTVIVIETAESVPQAVYTSLAQAGADLVLIQVTDDDTVLFAIKKSVEETGRKCLILEGDLEDPLFKEEVKKVVQGELNNTDPLFLSASF